MNMSTEESLSEQIQKYKDSPPTELYNPLFEKAIQDFEELVAKGWIKKRENQIPYGPDRVKLEREFAKNGVFTSVEDLKNNLYI